MPTQAYILNHDLWKAYQAVCLSGAGIAELLTLNEYDIDATEDDAEERVVEIIRDECECAQADYRRKVAA